MDIKKKVALLIKKTGNTIYPLGKEEEGWRAVISPLQYRNKLYVEEISIPAGMIDRGAFFYIGLPEDDLGRFPRGTLFVSDGEQMTLTHWETTYLKDEPQYVWAVFNYYGRREEKA